MDEKLWKKIRILIADDSVVCRSLLESIFAKDFEVEIIGFAVDGLEAVRLAKILQPDVITMDIHMPGLNGYEATRRIMTEAPCPIVIVSALTKDDQDAAFAALQAGALTVLNKPTINDTIEEFEWITSQVKLMAEVKVVKHWHSGKDKESRLNWREKSISRLEINEQAVPKIVLIAASTGGPTALAAVLRPFPANFPVPILVVQHITSGFIESFANWLNKQTQLNVYVAQAGDRPQAGDVVLAPNNYHMEINRQGVIVLSNDPPIRSVRPAADRLFASAAAVYKGAVVGVILTGMGDDGRDGVKSFAGRQAFMIAQDKESSTIFGMPEAAIASGFINQVEPLQNIAKVVLSRFHFDNKE